MFSFLPYKVKKIAMPVHRVYIVTGEKGEGKTNLVENVVQCMRRQGYTIRGFISRGFWKGNDRSHFELTDLENGNKILLCTRTPHEGWPEWGPFYFNPEAFAKAEKIVDSCLVSKPDLWVMDEIGKYEINGGGFDFLIQKLLKAQVYPQLWVVRRSYVVDIIEKYGMQNISIFDVANHIAPQICREIADQLPE
jgi:nucleoside-triphosphatase THEP1